VSLGPGSCFSDVSLAERGERVNKIITKTMIALLFISLPILAVYKGEIGLLFINV
jgi:hypothetical protein